MCSLGVGIKTYYEVAERKQMARISEALKRQKQSVRAKSTFRFPDKPAACCTTGARLTYRPYTRYNRLEVLDFPLHSQALPFYDAKETQV